jgi:lipid-binding SYLF domain-containing protein
MCSYQIAPALYWLHFFTREITHKMNINNTLGKTRYKAILASLLLPLLFATQANAAFFDKKEVDVDEERGAILEMRETVLERLYSEKPEAKELIANAKGYAVFDNRGINLFLLATGNGQGVVHDKSAGKDFYMKMFSAGGGIGMGVKTFSAVFVFHTQESMDQFVTEGWDVGAQADAAATSDGENQEDGGQTGLAVGIDQEVTVYQMTEAGLALQATLQGTKYWLNEDLN